MKKYPLSVAVSALINNNRILLIERIKGEFIGLLGLPGGKIEIGEHISETATREVLEEAGIKSNFKEHIGIVSEIIFENDDVLNSFILHVFLLEPITTNITKSVEGTLNWYDLDKIHEIEKKVIPSDYQIIIKMINKRYKYYFNCVLEKNNNEYTLVRFD